ncbi:protein of unknown function [Ruminococcaceae bacterium BL-6]|nr:protein of unknown function [Ruminococcaceae bacterium BL-6]
MPIKWVEEESACFFHTVQKVEKAALCRSGGLKCTSEQETGLANTERKEFRDSEIFKNKAAGLYYDSGIGHQYSGDRHHLLAVLPQFRFPKRAGCLPACRRL